jgi:hypothetical protein
MAGPFSGRLLPKLLVATGAVLASSSVPAFEPHVFVVTRDDSIGGAASLTIEEPWTALPNLEPVGVDPLVRHFFGRHYVVNREAGATQPGHGCRGHSTPSPVGAAGTSGAVSPERGP